MKLEELQIFSIIKCEFNSNDSSHIIKHPVGLPCGYSACFDCIRTQLKENKVNCNYCKEIHEINLEKLPRIIAIDKAIDAHCAQVSQYLIDELTVIYSSLLCKFLY